MGSPCGVNYPAEQKQPGTLLVLSGIKNHAAILAVVARPGAAGRHLGRRKTVRPAAEVQRMHTVVVVSRAILGQGDHKDSAIGPQLAVDHRCGCDAYLGSDLVTAMVVRRRLAAAKHRNLPKDIRAVRVKSVDGVVLSGYE